MNTYCRRLDGTELQSAIVLCPLHRSQRHGIFKTRGSFIIIEGGQVAWKWGQKWKIGARLISISPDFTQPSTPVNGHISPFKEYMW